MKKNKYPKHRIEPMTFEESHYVADGEEWKARDLVDFAKVKKYKVFDLPLCGIDLNREPFLVDNFDNFIFQMKRVNETDLKFPIILSDKGQIADGWHRVCKAILEGRETIKAIRLLEMPMSKKL